jgi:hypothetical protein
MSANVSSNGVANGDGQAAKRQKTEGTSLHDDHQCVLVLDYGSQYTQLICRRIREIGVFSMMFPGDASMVGFSFAHVSAAAAAAAAVGPCPDTDLIIARNSVTTSFPRFIQRKRLAQPHSVQPYQQLAAYHH